MALSNTDTCTVQYSVGGGPAVVTTYTATAPGLAAYSGVIPHTTSSAGQEIDMAFPHTEVVSVYLVSSQNMTLNTNSDGSPTQAIPLTANVPVLVNPFTSDVTKIYARDTSTTIDATVTLVVRYNASIS